MRPFARRWMCLVGLAGLLAAAQPAHAQSEEQTLEERLRALEARLKQVEETEKTEQDDEKAEESKEDEGQAWNEIIKIKGDLRLRYEGFDWGDKFDDGRRDRFRYRLRVGLFADLHEKLELGVELRSGNFLDPVSDNESFDESGTKDEIAIAQAYARWLPREDLWLQAGKFSPKKLWHVSDMQWDDDAVVDGVMAGYDWKPDGIVKQFDVRGYAFVLEENSSHEDSYWFGLQGGPTFRLSDRDTLLVGVGYDEITHPEEVARNAEGFSDDALFGGNNVTNLVIFDDADVAQDLVSDFEILTVYAEWKNKASETWPLKASLYWYKNLGAGDAVGIDPSVGDSSTGTGEDNDTGWYYRVQVGDYKKFKQMAFRYSRYDSEPDAIFYNFTQSDTVRASNVDAHRFDFRMGMPLRGYTNVTWYKAKPNAGSQDTMDRWQVDYIFRF